DDQAGQILEIAPDRLLRMPPLHTILRGGKRSGTRHVPVTLAARSTEIGTLELWCVARQGPNRWRLEFNVRDIVKDDGAAASEGGAETQNAVTDVWPESQVQQAAAQVQAVYASKEAATTPRELTKALEAALDAPRHEWPTGLCRRLWEFLAAVGAQRW